MTKVGIFGGSFDPIHYGHVYLAIKAKEELDLDRVIFVPAKLQPFKLDRTPADGLMRVEMIEASISHYNGAMVSMYELNKDEISYTYYTLEYFQNELGEDAKLYFITGTDSLLTLDTWYMADEMLKKYNFIVGSRPGYKEAELEAKITEITEKYGCEVVKIHNNQVDVSSSEIRAKVQAGESLDGLVNPKVERYINDHGLYR